MTKRNLLLAMLLAGALIIGASCQKENKRTEKINKAENQTECTSCQEGKELALKIKSFDNSLQLARKGAKTGETMPLNEAIDQMELLINASHGFPFEKYSTRTVESISFNLPVDNNGKVGINDLSIAYEEMLVKIKGAYSKSCLEEKGLIMVHLKKNFEAKEVGAITVEIVIGSRKEVETGPFTDCWFYGENLGMCDLTHCGLMDGGDTLANVIAANNPVFDLNDCPGPDYHIILDTLGDLTFEGNEYFLNNEYLMFFYPDDGSGFSLGEKQLSAEDMNHYYNNEHYLIYTMIPADYELPFPDYVLVNCFIKGNEIPIIGKELTALRHQNVLTYAKRSWVHDGILPKPTPID